MRTLARHFWPGPLTLVLKRSGKAKDFVTGAQDIAKPKAPTYTRVFAQALIADSA